MDAIERYKDLSGKPMLRWVPRGVALRYGPAVHQMLASATRPRRTRPAGVSLPDGYERIYLFHIRKTGGTSLVRSFLALGGEDPAAVEKRIAVAPVSRAKSGGFVFSTIPASAYFFAWSHTAEHRLRLREGTFTIALFRDPVSRVVSYYRYLVEGDSDPGMAWRVQPDERQLASGGFDEFINRVPSELLLNQLYMFSRSLDVSEAAEKVMACSAILTIEDYAQGLERLGQRLGLALRMRRERVTRGGEFAITGEQHGRLRERLALEYEMMSRLGIRAEAGQ